MNKGQRLMMLGKFARALRERQEHSSGIIQAKIRNSTHTERAYAWDEKRSYGWPTRHIQLAYGFSKGVPYAAIEAKVGDQNHPRVSEICEMAETVAGVQLNEASVYAWLEGQKPTDLFTNDGPEAEPASTPVTSPEKPQGLLDKMRSWVGL